VLETSARVPGTDGEKMSKSYNNTLAVFEDAKVQRKQIMRIVTDSRPMDQPKEPVGDVLFDLFSLVAPEADREAMAALYRRGGFGYGEVKKALADAAEKFWAEPRARRAELAAHPDRIHGILAAGAEKARKKAAGVLKRAQKACGISDS
jgi:tryptophanyl-tRNA synthetase